MSTVYRLETTEGTGAFQGMSYELRAVVWEYDPNRHMRQNNPSPQNDGIDSFEDLDFCGCGDWEQVFDWFNPSFISAFIEDGGELLELTVEPESIKRGGCQVVYRKDKVLKSRVVGKQEMMNKAIDVLGEGYEWN